MHSSVSLYNLYKSALCQGCDPYYHHVSLCGFCAGVCHGYTLDGSTFIRGTEEERPDSQQQSKAKRLLGTSYSKLWPAGGILGESPGEFLKYTNVD